jgi:hypothetical protein
LCAIFILALSLAYVLTYRVPSCASLAGGAG